MATTSAGPDRVTATEARVHFGEIYRRVTENDETIIIERNGKAGAVLISIEEFEALCQRKRGEAARPAWLEGAFRIGRTLAEEQPDTPPIDWAAVIREGREERDAELLEVLLRRESAGHGF